MSAKLVHPHGKEGRLTAWVNGLFDRIRGVYGRLLDVEIGAQVGRDGVALRHGRVSAASARRARQSIRTAGSWALRHGV
jgi:hypothetical protein